MHRPKQIALWGAGSLANWGDRLIAFMTEQELRRRMPGSQFQQFCPWSGHEGIHRLYFDDRGQWPCAASFDAVVVAGGGVLAGPPFKHPLMQLFCFGPRPAQFAPRLFTAWNAVGLQDETEVAESPVYEEYLRSVRTRLNYCSVRSHDTQERIGPGSPSQPTRVVPDSAYALPPVDCETPRRARPRLGVSLGSPFHSQLFLAKLTSPELASACPFDSSICMSVKEVLKSVELPELELSRRRTLLSRVIAVLKKHAAKVEIEFFGFGAMYGDQELAAALTTLVPGSRYISMPAQCDWDTLQNFIASYDALMVSRYHAAILAHRAGRPFIAVDPHWSPRTQSSKLLQLMNCIRHINFYWNGSGESERSTADLAGMLNTVLDTRPHIDDDSYYTLHQRSMEQFDQLASALLETPNR